MIYSVNNFLAVVPPQFHKIESKISAGGIAMNATRTELIELHLIFSYRLGEIVLAAGVDTVLVPGDAGIRAWAKRIYEWEGKQFVFMPQSDMVGYNQGERIPTIPLGGFTNERLAK